MKIFSLLADEDLFMLIYFHPAGEPDTPIACVIKGEA
jgi:hypothetical protein